MDSAPDGLVTVTGLAWSGRGKIKRVDVSVFQTIKAFADGDTKGGLHVFDLKVDGVGYSTSGGYLDDIKDKLDAYKADIISGKIVVPTTP